MLYDYIITIVNLFNRLFLSGMIFLELEQFRELSGLWHWLESVCWRAQLRDSQDEIKTGCCWKPSSSSLFSVITRPVSSVLTKTDSSTDSGLYSLYSGGQIRLLLIIRKLELQFLSPSSVLWTKGHSQRLLLQTWPSILKPSAHTDPSPIGIWGFDILVNKYKSLLKMFRFLLINLYWLKWKS